MKLVMMGAFAGAVALLAAAAPVAAQQTASSKVAYVNSAEVLRQTPGYAQAESTFIKERKVYEDQVQKLRMDLDSAGNDFERQSSMLNATQRAAKRKVLEDQQQKAQERFQDLQQGLAKRERELLQPIQSKVNAVIEGLRAAGNYAIIFDISAPNSGIITADRSLDLTDRVIQQLKAGS